MNLAQMNPAGQAGRPGIKCILVECILVDQDAMNPGLVDQDSMHPGILVLPASWYQDACILPS